MMRAPAKPFSRARFIALLIAVTPWPALLGCAGRGGDGVPALFVRFDELRETPGADPILRLRAGSAVFLDGQRVLLAAHEVPADRGRIWIDGAQAIYEVEAHGTTDPLGDDWAIILIRGALLSERPIAVGPRPPAGAEVEFVGFPVDADNRERLFDPSFTPGRRVVRGRVVECASIAPGLPPSFICVECEDNSSMPGLSGAPLVWRRDGVPLLVGIYRGPVQRFRADEEPPSASPVRSVQGAIAIDVITPRVAE